MERKNSDRGLIPRRTEIPPVIPMLRAGVLILAVVLAVVNISEADDSDYIVRVIYEGSQLLHKAEVCLYDTDRPCDTLLVHPIDAPSGDMAWTCLDIIADAEGFLPDRGLIVPRDVELHYAIARGTASDGSGTPVDFYSMFGCNDEIPPLSPSGAGLIEINMDDIPIYPSTLPSTHDFGDVELGSFKSQSFTFSNDSDFTVRLTSVHVGDSSFTWTWSSGGYEQLPPGGSFGGEVTFTPSDLGMHEGTLVVEYEILVLPLEYQQFGELVPLSGMGMEGGSSDWGVTSTVGVGSGLGSEGPNYLIGFLVPFGAVIFWKRLRRRK